MHHKNNVNISAVTHGGRFYTADKAGNHGAASMEVKALGNWSTGDAYSEVYNRGPPRRAMLASSMFNAEKPESYVLPRGILGAYFFSSNDPSRSTLKIFSVGFLVPPQMLLDTVFPWVEEEQKAYEKRLVEHGRKATDYALKHFLEVLVWFRGIILQDSAVLFSRYPKCALWTYAPFNTPEFKAFTQSSTTILQQAEEEARRKLEQLPETVAASMRGVVEAMEVRQNKDRCNINMKLDYVQSLLLSQVGSKSRVKRSQNIDIQNSVGMSLLMFYPTLN